MYILTKDYFFFNYNNNQYSRIYLPQQANTSEPKVRMSEY